MAEPAQPNPATPAGDDFGNRLTDEQDRYWQRAFDQYRSDGVPRPRAEEMAWMDLEEAYPELVKATGGPPV